MDHNRLLKELYSLDVQKFKLGLSGIQALLQKLGNPEKKLRCIHVAGTNGKGSVCAMISSILRDAGYNVGMYTSPHLKRFNERIRLNNRLISDIDIARHYLTVKKYASSQSFFEITTVMAFLYFMEKKADFAVLEAGLGGRLDATNVVIPIVSIITNVGYEHTEILGNTLSKIAFEKSGIIKRNVPVITAAKGIALKTITKISNKNNSILYAINNGIINRKNEKIKKYSNKKYENLGFDINNHKNLRLGSLKGKFQMMNAALAATAIDVLKKYYKIEIKESNLKNGLKNAKWDGRFQFLESNLLVDSAHNPDSFKVLVNELKNLDYKKLILVIGFSNDKDIKGMAKIIKPLADKIIITKSDNYKSADPRAVKRYFDKSPIIIEDAKNALLYAKKIADNKDLVLVTGSIYVVGEVM